MEDRLALAFLAGAILAGASGAQSTVRALPNVAFGVEPVDARPSSFEVERPSAREVATADLDGSGLEIELSASSHPSTDFAGGSGAVETIRGGWSARLTHALGGGGRFAIGFETEASFYELDGSNGLFASSAEPFNDLYRGALTVALASDPLARVSYFTGVELGFGGEDEVDLRDSATVGWLAGANYRANEELSLSIGIAALSRLEDDAWLIPFAGFDWKLDETWRLSTDGSSVELAHELGSGWRAVASAEFEQRQFRLNDDNPEPSGVLRDEEIRLALSIERKTERGLGARATVGVTPWRELELLDASGATIGEDELDTSPFFALALFGSF